MVIPANKKAFLTVVWKDKKGNVAKIDGLPVWATSDASITPLAPPFPADDPAGIYALGGVVGLAQVSVQGDADLGEGIKSLTAVLDTETIAGEAFAGTINASGLLDQ